MHKIISFAILISLSAHSFSQSNYTKWVNPFIGTGGHGHTYPGATLPHGMVQLSPDTRLEGWDGCSGYHYADSFIYGFSHTHLSGTGCSDFGDILLMPGNGQPSTNNTIYGSLFSHQSESASPGFYKVRLLDDNIDVNLTATERVGYHHYHFDTWKENYVLLDLKHRDEVIESSLKIEDSVTVSGMRRSKAWADNQYVYFVIKFSKPIVQFGVWQNEQLEEMNVSDGINGKNIKAYFRFKESNDNDLFVQVAISPVSIEGAKKNRQAEVGEKSFLTIKKEAQQKWNNELARIDVKSTDTNKLSIFYTALYHTAIVPNINMDVDGQYRGRDNQIHQAKDFTYYSVFSLWDTYRAAHPLYNIIDKKRTLDYIKTFLAQYQQGGRLPVWELASCETDCMIGYHSVPVIADAYEKGITGFDTKLALEAMLKSANADRYGLKYYRENGVIASEDEHESVSKTLEYSFDDYCIAAFAKAIGNEEVYKLFFKRSLYYENIFDPQTGFMRPKKNGDWLSPFDPKEVNNHFTEANSWQYSFYFTQDISGYIKRIGGKNNLEKKLDALFNESIATTGRNQSDITGMIGQYAHGNEPSHHIIYLYNYTNSPYKSQYYANKVMNEFYKNEPDGLIGNEDCGQMSAWYVLSSLGFYPVSPVKNSFAIGSPQFNAATIHLENGNDFVLKADHVQADNIYIQSASLHTPDLAVSKKWKHPYLYFKDIEQGGGIDFTMGKKKSKAFTSAIQEESLSNNVDAELLLNPVIHGGGMSFKNSKIVAINSPQKGATIFYTLDGLMPNEKSRQYRKPLLIDSSLVLKAIAIDKKGNKSFVSTAVYKKREHDWYIQLNTVFDPQYDGGGTAGLIDGIEGATNWRMGNWQGYQLDNVDVVIDMKKSVSIEKVSIGFLQDTRSWIVMPKSVSIEISNDGINFQQVYSGSGYVSIEDLQPQLQKVVGHFPKQTSRYVRVQAKQYGKLPSWHQGAGGDTYIFLDEISIQ